METKCTKVDQSGPKRSMNRVLVEHCGAVKRNELETGVDQSGALTLKLKLKLRLKPKLGQGSKS